MAGDGEGKVVPEEVDGAGLAVVVAEDAGDAALLGRQGVVDAGDLIDLLLPAEAVGEELRQRAAGGGSVLPVKRSRCVAFV